MIGNFLPYSMHHVVSYQIKKENKMGLSMATLDLALRVSFRKIEVIN